MEYDRMVDIRKYPSLDKENSEHIIDYKEHYQYCLNINYNRLHIPGKGSALFMHCFGPNKHFTGGCIAVPKDKMRYVMKHVRPNCLIVIDSLDNLGGKL
jgi:L,D-peptidoglycan transpeptidase YkuD (ErfK/YbiS/YcfS/YnhG family)